jgi:hypothetical protein
MANQSVTLKDVYAVVNRVEDKLDKLECRVSVIELWRAEIMGKITLIVGIVSLGFTAIWDWARKQINQ